MKLSLNNIPVLVITLSIITVNPSFGQVETLIPFELKDQFENKYTNSDFRGKIMLLIGSDGGGSKYNGKWGKAIDDALKGSQVKYDIHWVALADVSSAPFFMKGYVKNQFPEDEKEWVLLDWEGEFADVYHFKDDNCNILVFNRNGHLLYKTAGQEVRSEEVKTIVKIIRENYL